MIQALMDRVFVKLPPVQEKTDGGVIMAYRTLHELVEMLIDTCREDPFIEVYVLIIQVTRK